MELICVSEGHVKRQKVFSFIEGDSAGEERRGEYTLTTSVELGGEIKQRGQWMMSLLLN